MAYARTVYTVTAEKASSSEPQNRQFEVDFPYIDKAHVTISVNGTETTFYSWVNNARIELDDNPQEGDVITLLRESSPATRLVDYQTGSVLSEEILDKDSLQGFYLAQEANDIRDVTMSKNAAEQWDAEGQRITNVADPVDPGDVVNKRFLGSNIGAIQNVNQNLSAITDVYSNIGAVSQVANTLDSINTIAEGDTASNINTFANFYRYGDDAPTANVEGRVWFDTHTDTLKVWNGTQFQAYNTSIKTEFQGLAVNADGALEWTHGADASDFSTEDYDDWFFAQSDVTIFIDDDGHLKVRY
jgi:hypothetical protein